MSSEKKEFPLKTFEAIFVMFKNIDEMLKVLEKKEDENICYRCGRGGHYLSECYASFHADGYKI